MVTIYWAGDSTAKQYSIAYYPQTGIAQEFHRYTRWPDVMVQNHAEGGRSTKSFMDEGRLAVISERITAGDFLFIQFGHNDEKIDDPARYTDPETTFAENLEIFVNAARDKGAYPVIITPVTRYNRKAQGTRFVHDLWAASARRTAKKLGVALIDLTEMSEQLVDKLGEEARLKYYMNLQPGRYANYPDGRVDNSHLQPEGAAAFAGLIAKGLYELGSVYAEILSEEYTDWLQRNEAAMRALRDQGADERQ